MTSKTASSTKNEPEDYSKALMMKAAASTRNYCTCGIPVLQSRFCQQDFVILADVNLINSKPFYGLSTNHSNAGWPFSGTSIAVKVLKVVKGPLQTEQYLSVYFFLGSSCGVSSNMLPHRNGKYLLSGFRIEIPECKKIGTSCHLPEEIFGVTRCGWSQPIEELTITMIAGLFLNMYKCGKEACLMQPSFIKPSSTTQTDPNICHYDYRRSRCYSRFTICTRNVGKASGSSSAAACTIRAIRRMPTTTQMLRRIPSDLYEMVRRAQLVKVNDEDRFISCYRVSSYKSR
ncbi:hypothetical protein Aperf_G00000098182 [Anoplocephala perfoliata]